MNKTIKISAILLVSALVLTACGNTAKDTSSSSSSSSTQTSEPKKDGKKVVAKPAGKDFDNEIAKGEGTFDLLNTSGNTADGKIPVIYYDKNTVPTALSYSTTDLNGSQLSYIYVDGVLLEKQQLGTSQGELHLQDVQTATTEGIHTIQLVQYADDNEDGEIITFKLQQYELKNK